MAEARHIPDGMLRHMRGVAEQAYAVAMGLGLGEGTARELYVLGLLHDVGHAFGPADMHGTLGAVTLAACGYSHARAVAAHGDPDARLTLALRVLDAAILTVDGEGRLVTPAERVAGAGADDAKAYARLAGRLREEAPRVIGMAEGLVLAGRGGAMTPGETAE